jgi:hypothetical protein
MLEKKRVTPKVNKRLAKNSKGIKTTRKVNKKIFSNFFDKFRN